MTKIRLFDDLDDSYPAQRVDPGGMWTLGRKASALAAGSGPGGGSSGISDG